MGAAACSGVGRLSARAASEEQGRPLVVITGPSGCGKSTLLDRLFKAYPDRFGFSVSHTTRLPRTGEENGVHYHFIAKSDMVKLIEDQCFLEHAEFGSNMYGTSKQAVESVCTKGKICILDIELQGVLQVKQLGGDLTPVFVYIKPPTFETLEARLTARRTESPESLEKRLTQAKKDMEYISANSGIFHHEIVNDDLDKAFSELETALHSFL